MSHWTDEYLQQIEDCVNRESRLTEWEVEFLDSLTRQLENGRRPSVKQIEVLDRIWEKATERG